MIGIQSIGSYIPGNFLDNTKRLEEFNLEESFLKDKIGVLRVTRKNPEHETSDLCCKAFQKLQETTTIDIQAVDCLVVCTQNPDGHGLPHTSAIVHEKLNLGPDCAVFDISLGCSGYVYSLSIIKAFMHSNDLHSGLLFTSDPYSKIIDDRDKNTSLLFGDAATVTWVSEKPQWRIGKAVWGTIGKDHRAITVGENGLLSMNGRAVFNFAAQTIPQNIRATIEKNNLQLKDIDLFVMHQASRFIIDTLKKRIGVPGEKMPFRAKNYGNTVSSSIPLLIENIDDRHKNVLLCGFGVGLSWGSMVIQK